MNQNELKPSNATHNQQQQFKTNFSNAFINKRGFFHLGISNMSFTFSVFTRVQDSMSIKVARKTNISYIWAFLGNPRHIVIGGS